MPNPILYRLQKWLECAIPRATLRVRHRDDLRRLGSQYGGYVVPASLLGPLSICYSAGVGEDITFDLALIQHLGCEVFAFDPTPRAITFMEQRAAIRGLHFYPFGIWSEDTSLRFYAPANPTHVSHSVLNLQRTSEYFEARCKSLATLMRELGHDHIDLLKLNIEGAEYAVLDSMLADRIYPRVLCVWFDQPVPLRQVMGTVSKLQDAGYTATSVAGWCCTFVRE